jgi:hypothetical protein
MGIRGRAVWPWVWRLLIAAAILAAPVITFKAFTDPDTPDPQRDQRLNNVRESARPRDPARDGPYGRPTVPPVRQP